MSAKNESRIPAHNVFVIDDVTFSSNFDNGNLAKAERVPNKSYDFKIWTAPDNMGTEYQSRHCAWFYFLVTGLPMGCVLRIQVVNASNHSGLYKHDMRPVYKCNGTNQRWTRIRNSVRFAKDGDSAQMFFEHSVESANDKIFFAFTYPYTYTMVQDDLSYLDTNYTENLTDKKAIYYKREVLTRSLDNRKVDLLTITSVDGMSANEFEPLLSGLFPETKVSTERPHFFPKKEIVFVSCRVHAGEVPAQHTFKGILNVLMDPNDRRAQELRDRYVFKLIPMLNPDGVYRGHFRMDQLGQNLNRYYINPDKDIQPTIFAAKSLLDHYTEINKLCVYLDFHAHASKRGCFIYGNVLDNVDDQIQNQLYCKLIAMNSAHFDYEGCLFSREHMTRIDPGDQAKGLTAEGSGRVATYLTHRLIHSYTIECNYNTSRVGNEIAPTDGDPGGSQVTPPSPFTTNPEKYTPNTYAGVGRACVIALLDLRGHNPCSRLPRSKFKTWDRIKAAVTMEVRNRKEYMGKVSNRDRRRSLVDRKNGSGIAGSGSASIDFVFRRVVETEAPVNPSRSTSPAVQGRTSGSSSSSNISGPTNQQLSSQSDPDEGVNSNGIIYIPAAREKKRRPSRHATLLSTGSGNSSSGLREPSKPQLQLPPTGASSNSSGRSRSDSGSTKEPCPMDDVSQVSGSSSVTQKSDGIASRRRSNESEKNKINTQIPKKSSAEFAPSADLQALMSANGIGYSVSRPSSGKRFSSNQLQSTNEKTNISSSSTDSIKRPDGTTGVGKVGAAALDDSYIPSNLQVSPARSKSHDTPGDSLDMRGMWVNNEATEFERILVGNSNSGKSVVRQSEVRETAEVPKPPNRKNVLGSNKDSRKILGKKLHAAGVALLINGIPPVTHQGENNNSVNNTKVKPSLTLGSEDSYNSAVKSNFLKGSVGARPTSGYKMKRSGSSENLLAEKKC